MKKNKTLTGLEALDDIHECGEWIPVDATAIIRKQLIEFEELKQMEEQLNCRFKDIYHALKADCIVEFNGKETVAHAKKG